LELRHCTVCGQYWQLDIADRLQVTLAIKVADPTTWPTDDTLVRKKYLLLKRGLSNECCSWQDCQRKALTGLAFCDDHAWNMGIRD